MKKITSIIVAVMVLMSVLGGCKKTTEPTVSPNVPVVSESPAIPSPDIDESPNAGESPAASPKASPVTSPKASASA